MTDYQALKKANAAIERWWPLKLAIRRCDEPRTVDAIYAGGLAIHTADGLDYGSLDEWRIAHVISGRQLTTVNTPRQALIILGQLLSCDVDWKMRPRKLLKQYRPGMRQAKAIVRGEGPG